ncbi:MAG: hypothetical protein E7049_04980 [Lentisphaerae bacterium]|nr:hypothetical protein [Lentisphaerota bacterium]
MNTARKGLALFCAAACAAALADSVVAPKESLFPLGSISLDGGPLRAQQELNRKYLLQLEPDRLLSRFRREAGLDAKAPPYRGWESEGMSLPGHILGFYMSGAAMTVQATGDETLRSRLLYIVDELAEVQKANGSGFALAISHGKDVFRDIQHGKINVAGLPWNGHKINGHFEPTYTMNKLQLGLYQIWLATKSEKTKKVLLALDDWFGEEIVDRLDDRQLQTLLQCEHGSMPEAYVDAWRITGDEKYRRWAKRLCHERMLAPLADGNANFLTRFHANSNIPKYTGFEYVYQITGDERMHRACVNEWNDVVERRSWVVGGNGSDEHFSDPERFLDVLRRTGPESCNSVNMLRQTEALFMTDPSAQRMDFYERALFNHILATHDNERAMTAYFTPMFPGAYRVYCDPFDSMWCCTGTGLEAPGKYGQMVYTHAPDSSSVSVQLFAPSTLDWREKGVKIVQETDFPYSEKVRLTVSVGKPVRFALKVRKPAWCAKPSASVACREESGYLVVEREWKGSSSVEVTLPMQVRVERLPGSVPGSENYVAFTYGPVVLAGELGRAGGLRKESFWTLNDHWRAPTMPEDAFPRIVAEKGDDVAKMIRLVDPKTLRFRSKGFYPEDVTLAPFSDIHFQRYNVYWPVISRALVRELEAEKARNVDSVRIGDRESEEAHGLKSECSHTGRGAYGRHQDKMWRDASDGGWFSYDMKVGAASGDRHLRLVFWGRERGDRRFKVLVDGEKVADMSLGGSKDEFVTHEIAVPARLVRGKEKVTVRFEAEPKSTAGGIFGLSMLRN